jgi:rubrerythrin
MEKTDPHIEILELAIAREADAHRLYIEFSERTEDPDLKELFKGFASEELEHKARLELELIKLGIVVRPSAPLTSREPSEENEPLAEMDYKRMLLFAIEKERRSLRLYIDLAGMAKDKISREMLVTLAEEEAMHEARFEVEYNILMRRH